MCSGVLQGPFLLPVLCRLKAKTSAAGVAGDRQTLLLQTGVTRMFPHCLLQGNEHKGLPCAAGLCILAVWHFSVMSCLSLQEELLKAIASVVSACR